MFRSMVILKSSHDHEILTYLLGLLLSESLLNITQTNLDNRRKSFCDEYDFQARIQIEIYLGQAFLANTNTNIFGILFLANINTNIL